METIIRNYFVLILLLIGSNCIAQSPITNITFSLDVDNPGNYLIIYNGPCCNKDCDFTSSYLKLENQGGLEVDTMTFNIKEKTSGKIMNIICKPKEGAFYTHIFLTNIPFKEGNFDISNQLKYNMFPKEYKIRITLIDHFKFE